ncbi:MAG: phosphoenolpyruvate--protein phosphotransferase [Proteobacteria bacterium]|uniref:phosphoenolpyruvate--protein phosphotransferase n=1 Tax=Rudaea sp. TaxID=2136325 RepID=UPI00321F65B8|nr:phosphoenolpyruvate--protein phosphotransferase [Pseudomonadota bacterium]
MSGRLVLTGTAAARGMALGRARLVQPNQISVDERPLPAAEVEAEVAKLASALAAARSELAALRDKLHGALSHEVGEFIDAHSMILDDPELVDGLYDLIRTARLRASAALKVQRDRLVAAFDAIDDPYLRSRREDVDHVIGRVQGELTRDKTPAERQIAARVGTILVSDTVAPAELAQMRESGVLALVTTGGSPLSHSAILARSMRMPMLVGVHDALKEISDDDLMLVDGRRGEVVVHPTAQDLAVYRNYQREQARSADELSRLRGARTLTRDGVEIRLYANAEQPADIAQAHALGVSGVGLYRTEFLFLQRGDAPGEEEQFEAYRELVLGMGGLPVTIRTLDLGADKADSSGIALTDEDNPALGVRGVRLSMKRPHLFVTQLRAILRASRFGPVRILVPMVTTAEEVVATRARAAQCARELRSEGYEIADHYEFGAMIEVPAAAIALSSLIRHLDFASIGTNDLTQYILAADRGNDALGVLHDPLHPAMLKLLAQVIATGRRAKKSIALCGEMAGDTRYTAMLLALGLTDFSMHPSSLLEVRQTIARSDHARLRAAAKALLRAQSRVGIERVLETLQHD